MKKLLLFIIAAALTMAFSTSCKFSHEQPLGDTVSAKVFEPLDTSALNKARLARTKTQKDSMAGITDSTDIFFVGSGSTKHLLQLVSYPSHRDTTVYGKTAHLKVVGSAEIGNAVRVRYYVMPSGDSLVSRIEQYVQGK